MDFLRKNYLNECLLGTKYYRCFLYYLIIVHFLLELTNFRKRQERHNYTPTCYNTLIGNRLRDSKSVFRRLNVLQLGQYSYSCNVQDRGGYAKQPRS